MEAKEQFGRNLRELRRAAGLSQEALGERAHLNMSEISRLERGVREPRLGTIVRLARALELPAGRLLDDVA